MRALGLISVAAMVGSWPVHAADFEDKWSDAGAIHAGGVGAIYLSYLMFDPDNVDIDKPQRFNGGANGSYSSPLSSNVSFQLDAIADAALQREGDNDQTLFEAALGGHLSWRDPASHLVGIFGGGGFSIDDGDNDGEPVTFYFAGLEGEAYGPRTTLRGQVGFLDGDDVYLETIENAFFARAVGSYYITDQTRLSGELSYLHGGRPNNIADSGGVIDILGWGASLDHIFADHSFGLRLSYNGYDFRTTEESDAPWVHELRIGLVKYFGSPSILDNDRRAAGLDLPPVTRWISISTNEIE